VLGVVSVVCVGRGMCVWYVCVCPNFTCTSWSECRDGEQSRICSDINACEEERTETRDCVVPVREMPAAAVIADEKKIEVKAEKPDEKKISVLGVAGYVSYLWIALVSLVVIFAALGVYTRARIPKTDFTRRVREYDEGYDDSYKRLQELNRKIEKLRK